MTESKLAEGPLTAVLTRQDIAVMDGLVTVLVAPLGCSCTEFGELLTDPSQGFGIRVLTLDEIGTGTWNGLDVPYGDDDAWAAFAEAAVIAGDVVLVSGPLAEAASAAVWFAPAVSLTDGDSVEEARLRLSATARKSRMAAELRGGDFEAMFGVGAVPDHAALSDLVGRIVGYAWTIEGGIAPDRAVLFPDGIDNLSRTVGLMPDLASAPGGDDPQITAGGEVDTANPDGPSGAPEPVPSATSPPISGSQSLGDLPGRVAELGLRAYVPVLSPFDADVADHGSRSYGRAFIPDGTAWPHGPDGPLDLVLQLDVASLPDEGRAILGETGDFQVFLDLGNPPSAGGGDRFLARVVDTSAPGGYVACPGLSDAWARVPRAVIGWRGVDDAPDGTELDEGGLADMFADNLVAGDAIDLLVPRTVGIPRADGPAVDHAVRELGLIRHDAERLADALVHHDTDKLLGWPSWTQSPDWPMAPDGRAMRLLFQFQMWAGLSPEGEMAPDLLAADGTAHVFVTVAGEPIYAFGWACG